MCSDDPALGTCNGGVFQEFCCDTVDNCFDGSPCISTQRLCIGGEFKAFPCLNDGHCAGSVCRSTAGYCAGGDFDSFSCVDDEDCPGADCVFPLPTPSPSPAPGVCVGDCNEDGSVTVDEILIGVNLILRQASLSSCGLFDTDGNAEVTIDELLRSIQFLLNGCG
jgi:hypothetical protein